MIFEQTKIDGVFLVKPEPYIDDRGYFLRAYCTQEFKQAGFDFTFVQTNLSGNVSAGTLRGLHYQTSPSEEAKFLRCISGAIFDVMLDMRPESSTYLMSLGVELTAENKRAVLVPPRVAHGYLALSDGAEVMYMSSCPFDPKSERGVRFDDPTINVDWPRPVTFVSQKDRAWPDVS
ncbi:MAG: dTDP-4-dehydrorhamnose 3,5-epimerase [Pseudomonadota bacterium]